MPILSKSDPLIERIAKSAPRGKNWYELDYSLPDFSKLNQAATGELGKFALQQEWNERHTINFGQGAQAQAGSVLSNLGAPNGTNLFSGLIDIVKIDDPGRVIYDHLMGLAEKVLEQALDQLMEIIGEIIQDIFGSAFEAIGSIPIVGNILDIAWSVSRIIIDVIEMKRRKKDAGKPEQEWESATVSPEDDLLIANKHIMHIMNSSKDWTNIFMPRGAVEQGQDNFHSLKLAMPGDKARRFTVVDERRDWVGFVPGTIQTDNMWEINTYKYRVKWPSFIGGKEHGGSGVARSLGSLLPTTRDMGFLCWSQVNGSKEGASTSMFCVDADAAIVRWKEFLYQFRMWLKTGGFGGGGSQWSEVRVSESGRKKFVDELSGEDGFYGWGRWDVKYDSKKRYANFGVNTSHPVQALQNLRSRQRAFLHRVDVAYVGPDYGAVKNPEMRKLWEKNRQLLLQHPARRLVDVKSIPDLEYRNAMEYAKSSLIPQHKGTLTAYPPSLGNENAPPPYQPGGKADVKVIKATIVDEAKKRKSGKGGSVLLIALGLGLLAVAKGKK